MRTSPTTSPHSRRVTSPRQPEWCSGLEIAAGVDVLIHDAQYTDDEYQTRIGWGHSTLEHALAFARIARVKALVPFHFDPAHDDDVLDDFFADVMRDDRMPFLIVPAREDQSFEVRNGAAGMGDTGGR